VRPEEADVLGLDRPRPPELADHPGNRDVDARPVAHGPGAVEVDAVERGGEVVGVGLPADLAVGEDVQPGLLLGPDRGQGGVVLGLLQELRRDAPELRRPDARRELVPQPVAIDEPVGLGEAADDRGGQRR
jgi:hypothetical protein